MATASDINLIESGKQFVNVFVTSNFNSFMSERRFDRGMTVLELKQKMELLTGGSMHTMTIVVKTKEEKIVCSLDNNDALLGSFHIDDGMILHVEDKSTRVGEFEDTSAVPKFEMSTDDYNKRSDSVKAFKLRNKLGRFSDTHMVDEKEREEEEKRKLAEEQAAADRIKTGDRCEVRTAGMPTRRGTVRYVGKTKFKEGFWVGVQYDEPHGKNDGSVGGHRYFECPNKYGSFVKPNQVTVGDFPEEDFDLDEM